MISTMGFVKYSCVIYGCSCIPFYDKNRDVPICCCICSTGFLGSVSNVPPILSSISSTCLICIFLWCLKRNVPQEYFSHCSELLSCVELAHLQMFVQLIDDTSRGHCIEHIYCKNCICVTEISQPA